MAKDKDTWVNREFDKYILGEESPSQEPTSEQPAGGPGIGNEYLDKVAQGIVKMEGLLNRMEKLEAFVNHQEEQEKDPGSGTGKGGHRQLRAIPCRHEERSR